MLAKLKARLPLVKPLQRAHAAAQAHENRTSTGGQRRVRGGATRTRTTRVNNCVWSRKFPHNINAGKANRSPTDRSFNFATFPAPSSPIRACRAMDDSKSDKLDKKSETEVEVKLRIPDAACFAALRDMLLPCFRRAHEQENCFFDGASQELSSRHVVLRLRFYDVDRKAVMTMKGKQILQGGIGSALEVEEEIDVKLARQYLEDPSSMLTSEISVIKKLKETVGEIPGGLVSLGSFFNLRREYIWRGHVLELDQTSFPWGTLYEIEAETPKPEELKQELEAVLTQHDIPYSYSVKSKFANFIEKTLV